jgi:hypothetical protein
MPFIPTTTYWSKNLHQIEENHKVQKAKTKTEFVEVICSTRESAQ